MYWSEAKFTANILKKIKEDDYPYSSSYRYDDCFLDAISKDMGSEFDTRFIRSDHSFVFTKGLSEEMYTKLSLVTDQHNSTKSCVDPATKIDVAYNQERLNDKSKYSTNNYMTEAGKKYFSMFIVYLIIAGQYVNYDTFLINIKHGGIILKLGTNFRIFKHLCDILSDLS